MAKQRTKKRRRSPSLVPDDALFSPSETKRDKFVRIAEARMTKAMAAIELLGNLATYNYDWTEEDVARMKQQLQETADRTFRRYTRRRRGEGHSSFHLREDCH